jgi:LAO/AO transport system kinase
VSLRVEQDSQIKKAPWQAVVVKTVAVDDMGTESLVDAIKRHRKFLEDSGQLESGRREKARQETLSLLREEISRTVLQRVFGDEGFEDLIDDIIAHKKDPYRCVQEIVRNLFLESE